MTIDQPPEEADGNVAPPSRLLTRRNMLLLLAGGVTAALGTVAYTMLVEPFWVSVRRRAMPLRGLPDDLVGKRLIHISDLHLGRKVDTSYLVRAVSMIADLEPDLIVITGDLTDAGLPRGHEPLQRLLRAMPQARLGTFAVLGNHDYGKQWSQVHLADAVAERCSDYGVRVLRNESVGVSGLTLTGLDDYWSPRFDAASALATARADSPHVVLCHNPDVCDLDVWGSFQGWILAGHTHGGQCKPPFLPPPLLPVKNRRYTAGHFEVGAGRDLYINPGLGYILAARFNVRPEITVFTLEKATGSLA